MSYAPKWCRDLFTQEQLSVFLTIAETYRADHLTDSTSGACCNESGTCVEVQEYQCLSQDWNWQGLGTICEDGCLQNALGACCAGTNGGCINNLLESMCLAGNGTWLGPFTVCEDGGCALTCDGDVDGSNTVDVNDLLAVIDQWGLTNSPSDINDDGIVDVSDLLMVVGNWGPCDEESTYGGCPDGAESDCDDCWNNGDAPSDCTQPITIGVPVCGTVSVFTNDSGNVARDMDLFSSATLNGGGNFTLSAGSSGAEMMLGIIDNYSGTLVEANILEGGFEDSFSIDGLPEGNYNIFVTTNNGDTDWSCDSGLVEYWVQLD
jgi:hypothetical protein